MKALPSIHLYCFPPQNKIEKFSVLINHNTPPHHTITPNQASGWKAFHPPLGIIVTILVIANVSLSASIDCACCLL